MNWTLCSHSNSADITVGALLDSCWIHVSCDLQAVESLHVTNGTGQNLSRSHSGHLPTRLREVSIQPEPRLTKSNREKFNTTMTIQIKCHRLL